MKRLLIVLIAVMSVLQMIAQTEYVILRYDGVPKDSKFSKIAYLDSRSNQKDFGFLNGRKVIDDVPLAVQLEAVFPQMINNTQEDKIMLIQLRKLSFFETKSNDGDLGVCVLRVNLYQKEVNDYYFINKLDTVIESSPGNILSRGVECLTSYIANNLDAVQNSEVPFSLSELQAIDDFEKEDIPLYLNKSFVDGIYYDFYQFAQQNPDTVDMRMNIKKNELKDVKVLSTEGKWRKIPIGELYAVVADGKAYIAYDRKFRQAYFDGNDLKFRTTKTETVVPPGVSVGVEMGRGFGGGIGFSFGTKKKSMAIMLVDHQNGIAEECR